MFVEAELRTINRIIFLFFSFLVNYFAILNHREYEIGLYLFYGVKKEDVKGTSLGLCLKPIIHSLSPSSPQCLGLAVELSV